MPDIIPNILSVVIDGITIDYQRQTNNCLVNLTKMAKPFGKRPKDWLRNKDTQDYLSAAKSLIFNREANSPHGNELIITRQGGPSEIEQGTWATDYRIAMRFAQWLDPLFALKVDELLVRIVSGELVVSGAGVYIDPKGQHWISRTRFCKELGVSEHSFNGLMSSYRRHFAQIGLIWYVSAELFKLRSVQQYIATRKNEVKRSVPDATQLSLDF